MQTKKARDARAFYRMGFNDPDQLFWITMLGNAAE
jgi:hypothetical protein